MPTPREGYFLYDGTRVPSVTTILHNWGDSSGLIQWAAKLAREGKDWKEERDRAGRIGTLAHKLIEQFLSDNSEPMECDQVELERARVSFEAFKLWWGTLSRPKLIVQEEGLVSEKYGYGGTLDAVIEIGGKPTLCDWKTSTQIRENNVLQVIAYKNLLQSADFCPPFRDNPSVILHLPLGDTPKFNEYRIPWSDEQFDIFKGLLSAYKGQQNLKPSLFRVKL